MASHAQDGEFGFQIAPMLDVLFVLLLFFMVSAGVQKWEHQLVVPLPGGPGGQVPLNVDIASDGSVILNGAVTGEPGDHLLRQTTDRVQAALADTPARPVVIRPDPSTRQQSVVDVLIACRTAGAKNIAFGKAD